VSCPELLELAKSSKSTARAGDGGLTAKFREIRAIIQIQDDGPNFFAVPYFSQQSGLATLSALSQYPEKRK